MHMYVSCTPMVQGEWTAEMNQRLMARIASDNGRSGKITKQVWIPEAWDG